MIDPRPYLVAGALALAFGGGWWINGWRLGKAVADLKATHASTAADSLREGLREFTRVVGERDAAQAALTKIAADGLERIRKANNETERMRRCLADGSCGLRIAASCPPAAPDVPPAAGGGVVDSAAGAVLTAAAGQDYLALRANIIRTEETLSTCQAALERLTGVSATTPAGQSAAP